MPACLPACLPKGACLAVDTGRAIPRLEASEIPLLRVASPIQAIPAYSAAVVVFNPLTVATRLGAGPLEGGRRGEDYVGRGVVDVCGIRRRVVAVSLVHVAGRRVTNLLPGWKSMLE